MEGDPANSMLVLLAILSASALMALLTCYLWGRLMGRTARRMQRSQWRAYGAALFPFLVLFATLICNETVAEVSLRAFLGLAAPALVGAFRRWHSPVVPHAARFF